MGGDMTLKSVSVTGPFRPYIRWRQRYIGYRAVEHDGVIGHAGLFGPKVAGLGVAAVAI